MELLDLREKRDHFEKELLMKYKGTLLTLRANFPGEDKRHEKADLAVRILYEEVRKHFNPIHEEMIQNAEGLILFLLLKAFCQGYHVQDLLYGDQLQNQEYRKPEVLHRLLLLHQLRDGNLS